MRILLLLLIGAVGFGFSQTEDYVISKVNTKYNRKYVKSRKTFEGVFPDTTNAQIRLRLQNELNVPISDDNHILIHYEQMAHNCIKYNNYDGRLPIMVENIKRSDNKLLRIYQTMSFWVYNDNSFFSKQLENESYYYLDSGYFKKNIFELNDNCSAFFLLKSSGEFMIHYGEDYMTEVYNYLKR